MTETDLFPAVGGNGEAFSIRHNKTAEEYEIFDFLYDEPYTDDAVIFSGDLDDVIGYANMLEEEATGSSSFEYGHRPYLYGCDSEGRFEP